MLTMVSTFHCCHETCNINLGLLKHALCREAKAVADKQSMERQLDWNMTCMKSLSHQVQQVVSDGSVVMVHCLLTASLHPYMWSCLTFTICLLPAPIKSLRANLPGELRLNPHASSPGWHAFQLVYISGTVLGAHRILTVAGIGNCFNSLLQLCTLFVGGLRVQDQPGATS